jgi:hypothetical protein
MASQGNSMQYRNDDRIEEMDCFALGWHFGAKGGRFSERILE